jgi:hypothetical protein
MHGRATIGTYPPSSPPVHRVADPCPVSASQDALRRYRFDVELDGFNAAVSDLVEINSTEAFACLEATNLRLVDRKQVWNMAVKIALGTSDKVCAGVMYLRETRLKWSVLHELCPRIRFVA